MHESEYELESVSNVRIIGKLMSLCLDLGFSSVIDIKIV